eukprot:2832173-Amphidinium_carterae.1
MITLLDAGDSPPCHKDEYNALLKWFLPLPSGYGGGDLWLAADTAGKYVHRDGDHALERDPLTLAGTDLSRSDRTLELNGKRGWYLHHPGQWTCFDPKRRHST